jgi:hypothetical protein
VSSCIYGPYISQSDYRGGGHALVKLVQYLRCFGIGASLSLPVLTYAALSDSDETKSINTGCSTSSDTVSASNGSRIVDEINIQSHPIFDETDPSTIGLHRLANKLHIVTKNWVIEERLTFVPGDDVDDQDLKEAEAILRNERYLRDAKIRFVPSCSSTETLKVNVETWDNWSLIPTLSFSRSGGYNKSTIGIKQDNLFGMGIRTRIRYNQDEQRRGYQLTLESAAPWTKHANLYLNLLDNDDGKQLQLVYNQPFFHLGTERMRFAEFLQDERTEDIFQNGQTRNSLNIEHHRYQVAYGWQLFSDEKSTARLSIGMTNDQAVFTLDEFSPSVDPLFLAANRNFQYPWIAYEHLQRDIIVMQDIYLIQQAEDINLGWYFRSQLGLELNDIDDNHDLGYHIFIDAQKGTQWGKGLFMFDLNARADINTTAEDHLRVDLNGEYFYQMTEIVSLYARLSATLSSNPFLDAPVVLDDDTGVRGYPAQYQHGDHSISGSLEARLYTGYSFYKLFDLGFATFFDVGKAFDGDVEGFNESDSILASAGIGARLFSNRSSNGGVIHMDFTRPLTQGDNVDTWEWRIQMRRAF